MAKRKVREEETAQACGCGETQESTCCGGHEKESKNRYNGTPAGNAVYGIGLIGALVYYIGHATGFASGVIGFLKALVWPAMLVYKALEFLKM